mmetsp:Transcript_25792/g.41709  ORF Transcript_25792/g.41709 Transcript_25792/m.41709 type:complete len:515 (+) Transcript_25792:169-1713(+)
MAGQKRDAGNVGVPTGKRTKGNSMVTPNRVASIRSQAKAKGLSTPSPGRANAAFTMLQLTGSAKTNAAKCVRTVDCDRQSAREIAKALIGLFADNRTILNQQEIVKRYGFADDVFLKVLRIFSAVGICVQDSVSKMWVWNGTNKANESIYEVLQLAEVSTSNSVTHQTRRLIAHLVSALQRDNKLPEVHSSIKGSMRYSTLAHAVGDAENVNIKEVQEISTVLVEVGLVQIVGAEVKTSRMGEQNIRFAKSLPAGAMDVGITDSPIATIGKNGTSAVTPAEGISKPAQTPSSGDGLRGVRRTRVISRTDKNINRRVLGGDEDEQPQIIKKTTRSKPLDTASFTDHCKKAYFHHPGPTPNLNNGETPSCLLVSRSIGAGTRVQTISLPTPESMLRYQASCLREFMARYNNYYIHATRQGKRTEHPTPPIQSIPASPRDTTKRDNTPLPLVEPSTKMVDTKESCRLDRQDSLALAIAKLDRGTRDNFSHDNRANSLASIHGSRTLDSPIFSEGSSE